MRLLIMEVFFFVLFFKYCINILIIYIKFINYANNQDPNDNDNRQIKSKFNSPSKCIRNSQ